MISDWKVGLHSLILVGLSRQKWDELCCAACAELQIFNADQCRHFTTPAGAHNGSVFEVLILILTTTCMVGQRQPCSLLAWVTSLGLFFSFLFSTQWSKICMTVLFISLIESLFYQRDKKKDQIWPSYFGYAKVVTIVVSFRQLWAHVLLRTSASPH